MILFPGPSENKTKWHWERIRKFPKKNGKNRADDSVIPQWRTQPQNNWCNLTELQLIQALGGAMPPHNLATDHPIDTQATGAAHCIASQPSYTCSFASAAGKMLKVAQWYYSPNVDILRATDSCADIILLDVYMGQHTGTSVTRTSACTLLAACTDLTCHVPQPYLTHTVGSISVGFDYPPHHYCSSVFIKCSDVSCEAGSQRWKR